MILNARGDDITRDLTSAAGEHGIPLELALGCAIAESGLRPDAERWGTFTTQAKAAIANQDMVLLQDIISRAWADVSFGYGQQIVLYHYLGDKKPTVDNCLEVRRQVFNDPVTNLRDMCKRLEARLRQARSANLLHVGGDVLLMACVIYNRGHVPVDNTEWTAIKSRVDHYRRSLQQARDMLAVKEGKKPNMTAIDDRASGNDIKDKLGDALSEEIEISADVHLKKFYNAVLLDVQGDVYCLPEATVADKFRAAPGG